MAAASSVLAQVGAPMLSNLWDVVAEAIIDPTTHIVVQKSGPIIACRDNQRTNIARAVSEGFGSARRGTTAQQPRATNAPPVMLAPSMVMTVRRHDDSSVLLQFLYFEGVRAMPAMAMLSWFREGESTRLELSGEAAERAAAELWAVSGVPVTDHADTAP